MGDIPANEWGLVLDHVNIRTADLDGLIAFYGRVLGLQPGPRPPFAFPGAWLYAGDRAVVHLIGVEQPPESGDGEELRLEHFAFRGRDLQAFLDRLEREGVEPQVAKLPDGSAVQVNIWDPEGNHLHIDFQPPPAE